MNTQPIEKHVLSDGEVLQVHSIFDTIQGEGPFTGRRSIFIRLAGCNLQCPQCDTDYTSSVNTLSLDDIRQKLNEFPGISRPIVVITGGEPFRQNIEPLVRMLIDSQFTVQIETNGTLPPPNIAFFELCSVDLSDTRPKCFVVCSPKTGKVHRNLVPLICAYKYVMGWDSVGADGLPIRALGHSAAPMVARPDPGFGGPVYLQPADYGDENANKRNLNACIASVMRRNFILQLQVHKILGVE